MWGHCQWGLTVTPGVRTTGCFLSLDVPASLAEQGVAGSRILLRMLLASQLSTFFLRRGQGWWIPQRKSWTDLVPLTHGSIFGIWFESTKVQLLWSGLISGVIFFPMWKMWTSHQKLIFFFCLYFFMRCKFSSIKLNKVYKLLWSHFRLFCCDIQYIVMIVGASIANHLFQVSSLIRNTAALSPLGKEGVSFKISVLTEFQFCI